MMCNCGHSDDQHYKSAGACGYIKITGTGCDTECDSCLCSVFIPVRPVVNVLTKRPLSRVKH